MRVLVVYASRYGATHEIAERIAATLRQQSLDATCNPQNMPMIRWATTPQ
jgi:menaquinone-dependent protoporphyrinogen IX oxidase